MARTFSVTCVVHREKLDAGTIRLNGDRILYYFEAAVHALRDFLFDHAGCALMFDDDEKLSVSIDGFNEFKERADA